MSHRPERLTARIRQIRRALATPDVLAQLRETSRGEPDPVGLQDLQARVAHLEQLLQGLQDAVYRESRRHDRRISELEVRIEPATLAAALSRDARDRGL
jgi:hypothetical protein